MLSKIKVLLEENKFAYLNKMHQLIEEASTNLPSDPIIHIIKRHHSLMLSQKFDWIHESETENLNFNDLKGFLADFLSIFNKEIARDFSLCKLFKKVFPLECVALYFKNVNLSFGNKVYDESLRFKTNLLRCFKDLCLEADFVFNYKIKFDNGFDFSATTRNAFRAANRREIVALYETPEFSLKAFVFFLMDNYYPRVGWRWIGASHFVYYLTLEILVLLFELGFWTVADQEAMFLKLYEICEVMVSLEKNSAKDSERLAETFNNELINGFSNAREQLTLAIIHSYQLLVDANVDKGTLKNLKFYYNLIITRYIFNSTKIKKNNLRKSNNLRQILYYLNSSNFETGLEPQGERGTVAALLVDPWVGRVEVAFEELLQLILTTDPDSHSPVLFDRFLDIFKMIFGGLRTEKLTLESLIVSKVLKRMMPIINLLKDQFKEETEEVIDLALTLFHRVCLRFDGLLHSQYLKSVIKDFFGIEPFKNLHIISRLIVVGNVQVNKYFFQYLGSIFTSIIKEIMTIFSKEASEVTTNHEIFVTIVELFIQFFTQINRQEVDFDFVELKMVIVNAIHTHFVVKLEDLLADDKSIVFDPSILSRSYEELLREPGTMKERVLKVRTKEAYLLLRLYTVCLRNSYKCGQHLIDWKNADRLLSMIIPGHPCSSVLVAFFNETFFLPCNNLINDRLKHNKSKQFILMENSFPLGEKDLKLLFNIMTKVLDLPSDDFVRDPKHRPFIFQVALPFVYKFMVAFLYLNDEPKVSHLESSLERIFRLTLRILQVVKGDSQTVEAMYARMTDTECDPTTDLYQKLPLNDSTYTNYARLKKQMVNLIFWLSELYRGFPEFSECLEPYQRGPFEDRRRPLVFNENLEDIITKVDYISSIDLRESMTNMLTYFIDEFQRCSTEVTPIPLNARSNSNTFTFLKEEYKDLLCTLTTTFQRNSDFKRTFVEIIENDKDTPDGSRFFTKFWAFYRDALFFSAYNFFHCKLWNRVAGIFLDLNDFMLTLTKTSPGESNRILQYFVDFKLVTSYHNNHTLFFQMYVVLECLGNYSKLLTLQNHLLIEHKDCILFVIENVLRTLSNVLVLPVAQERIYIYRIDIWMNLVLANVESLNEAFYRLKGEIMNYFLAICSRDNPQIVKFYGANVNPESMKSSINKLFRVLLEKRGLLTQVLPNSLLVHAQLEHDNIYQVVLKIYKFYTILVRHDVQTNYLNLFMFQKLDNMDPAGRTTESLLASNLLFFYYANRVFSKLPFKIGENNFCIKEILQDANRVKVFPPLINMVKEGKIKLWDYLVNLKNEPTTQMKVVNEKLSVVLQILKSTGLRTNEENLVIKKIQENDLDWIETYLFTDV